jgi:hypothetical protein
MTKTGKAAVNKSFLDTTVLRSLWHSPEAHKRYLAERLQPGTPYVSQYVKMEYRRGFMLHALAFHDALRMPNLETIDDVQRFLAESFEPRRTTALMGILADMSEMHEFRSSYPRDKERARRAVVEYLKRLEWKLKSEALKDVGVDPMRCSRAKVEFNIGQAATAKEVTDFRTEFNDMKRHRASCRIGSFVLEKNFQTVQNYLALQQEVKGREAEGFKKLCAKLETIASKGETALTCKTCATLGDLVIALSAPRTMQLEHTDHSFDYLCPPVQQPHQKHDPMMTVVARSVETELKTEN